MWSSSNLLIDYGDRVISDDFGVDLAVGTRLTRVSRVLIKKSIALSTGLSGRYFQLQHESRRKKPVKSQDVAYKSIYQVFSDIAALKFVIASRLHFGMSAWGCGVPAYLISPLDKAKIASQKAGLGDYIFNSNTKAASGTKKIINEVASIQNEIAKKLQIKRENSTKHFTFLEKLICC